MPMMAANVRVEPATQSLPSPRTARGGGGNDDSENTQRAHPPRHVPLLYAAAIPTHHSSGNRQVPGRWPSHPLSTVPQHVTAPRWQHAPPPYIPHAPHARGSRQYAPTRHPPPFTPRQWAEGGGSGSSGEHCHLIRVMSYNILADGLANEHRRELYGAVPATLLAWPARRAALLREVAALHPDVLALQELDRYDDVLAALTPLGYQGTYVGRDGQTRDGCGTFWKRDVFQQVAHEKIQFSEHGLRHNVALLMALRRRDDCSGQVAPLLVANTHILFNPKRGDIKLGQMRVLLERLRLFAAAHGGGGGDGDDGRADEAERRADAASPAGGRAGAALVLGDFNCTPQSPLHRFLLEGWLHLDDDERRHLSGTVGSQPRSMREPPYVAAGTAPRRPGESTCARARDGGWGEEERGLALGSAAAAAGGRTARHDWTLRSAYATVTGGEPAYTSYHEKFIGTVDYMWFTPHALRPRRVLLPLPLEVLDATVPHRRWCKGLPTDHWASDHMALVCEFDLRW